MAEEKVKSMTYNMATIYCKASVTSPQCLVCIPRHAFQHHMTHSKKKSGKSVKRVLSRVEGPPFAKAEPWSVSGSYKRCKDGHKNQSVHGGVQGGRWSVHTVSGLGGVCGGASWSGGRGFGMQ